MYKNPYENLPDKSYWKKAVGNVSPFNISDMYNPKFPVERDASIAAAGSCFAQHISRNLKSRGYRFLDYEPPMPGLTKEEQNRFGLDLYSARYGNIYSMGQLYQLAQRAFEKYVPEEEYWTKGNRFYDPFRPGVEPNGFDTKEALIKDTKYHLNCVRKLIRDADILIFTFGLTETWISKNDGSILPTCPGTVAGKYDPTRYVFQNSTHSEVLHHAEKFIAFVKKRNPNLKFIFTVSPVPLTATASGEHVLPATIYSKSVLRSVCGELHSKYDFVDYFPSYEIISSYPYRGMFFEPNMRSVTDDGVAFAMSQFFKVHERMQGGSDQSLLDPSRVDEKATDTAENIVCEEEILEAFGN